MKNCRTLKLLVWLCLGAMQSPLLGLADGAAPVAATNAPVATVQIPKSEFDEALPNGRDPFYPRSRAPGAAGPSTGATKLPPSMLILRGVSGPPEKRLAVINNTTFSVGEKKEVVIGGGRILVLCEEIRDDLVVVFVGEPPQRMELRLQKR